VMVWRELTWAYQSVALALDQGTIDRPTSSNTGDWRAGVVCTCDDLEKTACTKQFDPTQLRPLEHLEDWPHSVAKKYFPVS
jgi:hypothetical protein